MARKKIASAFGAIKMDRNIIKNQSVKQHLTILKDLEDFIPPLTEEESSLLEESLIKEGCKEPLTVWEREYEDEVQYVLIDGHNRYKLCQKNNIEYKTKKPLFFESIAEAKDYMIDLQMGRRNLTDEQKSYLRGQRYNNEKQSGFRHADGNTGTAARLAQEYNVSARTVERDALYAQGIDKIAQSNSDLKNEILKGTSPVKKSEVQQLAKVELEDKLETAEDIKAAVSAKPKAIKEKVKSPSDEELQTLKQEFQKASTRLFKYKDKEAVGELVKLLVDIEELL